MIQYLEISTRFDFACISKRKICQDILKRRFFQNILRSRIFPEIWGAEICKTQRREFLHFSGKNPGMYHDFQKVSGKNPGTFHDFQITDDFGDVTLQVRRIRVFFLRKSCWIEEVCSFVENLDSKNPEIYHDFCYFQVESRSLP